jgi:hypothetical protein
MIAIHQTTPTTAIASLGNGKYMKFERPRGKRSPKDMVELQRWRRYPRYSEEFRVPRHVRTTAKQMACLAILAHRDAMTRLPCTPEELAPKRGFQLSFL